MSDFEGSNDVQVFNNEAFDSCGGSDMEKLKDMKGLWMGLNALTVSDNSSKENQNPLVIDSPSLCKTPISYTMLSKKTTCSGKNGIKDSTLRDERMIDKEIEEIEIEKCRLSLKLEALKLEKAEIKKQRIKERRCSIVPAKYMETKSILNANTKLQDSKQLLNRRGMSLCPAEIYSASKSRHSISKPDFSNSSSVNQNRRQSCFWKLGEIDELKITNSKKVASVTPKAPHIYASTQAATTIGSKNVIPKKEAVLSSVQPKKLFKDSTSSSKKPFKTGRVIPSRYNQTTSQNVDSVSAVKARSLCELDEVKAEVASKDRVKKRWEIPAKREVVVYMGDDGNEEELQEEVVVQMQDQVLKKIRTARCVSESPRDSGAMKRVAEYKGKIKCFFADGGDEAL